MKLIAPADALRPAIEACAEIADKTGKRPVYAATRIDCDGSAVKFSAMNGTESLQLNVSDRIDPTSVGSVFLPSANLARIVKDAKKDTICLQWNGKSLHATLDYGTSRLKLPVEPPENLPPIVSFNPAKPFFTLTASALTSLFKRTTIAVQTDFTNRSLHGVCIRTDGATLKMASTDGRRFALVTATVENPDDAAFDTLAPPPGPKLLARVAGAGEDEVKVQATPSLLIVNGPSGQMSWRLISGKFPDYEGHVPLTAPFTMTLNRKDLLETLERHQLIKSVSSIKHRLTFTAGNLEMFSSAGVDGETTVNLELPWVWDDFVIHLDPGLVTAGLAAMSSEEITFGVDTPKTPVVFREIGKPFDCLYMVVPMSEQ